MAIKIRVLHGYYGCETGCCGHMIEVEGDYGKLTAGGAPSWGRSWRFDFGHPDNREEALEWAKQYVSEVFGPDHVKDLDWENSTVEVD